MRKVLPVLLLLLPALAACGGDDDPQVLSDTEHSAQDVAFASDMVQHHAQALLMVDLTIGRDLDPEVQALAEDIRAAQAPEIELMTDWLVSWDEEVPETVRDHANAGHAEHGDGGDHDAMGDVGAEMPGMVAEADLEALEDAPDAEFGDRWLELMVEHHEGAVAMARTQVEEGTYRPAVDLAGTIIAAQEAEIERMRDLLG